MPYFGLLDNMLKIKGSVWKQDLLCAIPDDVLAGVAVLVS